jgi:Putative bacterial sensory transduction regulator
VSEARSVADAYIASLGEAARRVADGEWGVTIDDAAGWPLHVGIRLADGFLRAQAEVVDPGRIDDHVLLHWNRSLPLVRFSHTGAGAVWVQGDLPLEAVSAERLDGFLGLLVRVATQAREAARP